MEEARLELETEVHTGRQIAGDQVGADPRADMARQPSAARILVVGVDPSLTWAVIRCLSRAGMRPVVLGSQRFSPLQLVPDCRYLPLRALRSRGAELEPSLIEQVAHACLVHGIDRVVPADFSSGLLLSRYGAALSRARVCAVPNADIMLALHNKWQFSRTLERIGLPQPRTELARTRDELLRTRFRFPIVTKPVERAASAGMRVHASLPELWQTLDAGRLGSTFPVIVQAFVPGRDVGFAFLARHGQLVAHVASEAPTHGVRRCYEAPELRRYVVRLLAATGYHGVGEIAARYDPSCGAYRLLALHPRFWASLLFTERAGMNFPELLLRLDELGDGPGFRARPDEVRLCGYELLVARSVQWAERAHTHNLCVRACRAS